MPAALTGTTGTITGATGTITGATGDLTIGYYVTDLVASQTHAGATNTWTLDPNQRLRRAVLAGTAKINHYDDNSDSPAWIDEGFADGSLTRYIAGIDGGTIGYHQTANTYTITRYYLTDLHGDIKTTTDPNPGGGTPNGPTTDTDEYGNPYTTTGSAGRYNWLGDHQRSTDALAGTTLMGLRLYQPTLGRFLTTDPVHGGGDNTYSYPTDPINQLDLDGRCWSGLGRVCDAANWTVRNRGLVASGLATAGCLVPGVGWAACAGLQAGALAVRSQQRASQGGGVRATWRATAADAAMTSATFGLGQTVRFLQLGRLGAVRNSSTAKTDFWRGLGKTRFVD